MAGYVTRGVRMLSGCLLETMATDQLTPQQKAVSGLIPGYFDSHGWGFGVSIVTRHISPAEPVDIYGWNGGLATLWNADPKNDLAGILLTQRAGLHRAHPMFARISRCWCMGPG